jgi:hypothetical protein
MHTLVQELRHGDSMDGIRGIPPEVGDLESLYSTVKGKVHIIASGEYLGPDSDPGGLMFTASPSVALVWNAQQFDGDWGTGNANGWAPIGPPDGVADCSGPSYTTVETEDAYSSLTAHFSWSGTAVPNLFKVKGLVSGTSYVQVYYDPADDPFEWNYQAVVQTCDGPHVTISDIKGTITYTLLPTPLAPWVQVPYCASTPNSTGQTALLYAGGSNKVADELLFLSVENVPKWQFGYFLVSQAQVDVPGFGGGAGTLCLGAPILRVLDSIGTASNLGHVAYWWNPEATPVAFIPGDVWNFQYWFRDDPAAGLHNTSNGLSVTFE